MSHTNDRRACLLLTKSKLLGLVKAKGVTAWELTTSLGGWMHTNDRVRKLFLELQKEGRVRIERESCPDGNLRNRYYKL